MTIRTKIYIAFTLLISFSLKAQLKLEKQDFENLIAMSELYSANPNAAGSEFSVSINSLRTPMLNHVADGLIAIGSGDSNILESKFLSRPTNDQLMLWYVVRKIHYNAFSKIPTNKTSSVVANEVLARKIDERWLLDNYYYRLHGGFAMLFNTADLTKYDINIDALGFKNETEKAIFYFNFIDALVGGRFKVLNMMKKYDKLQEFAAKLPKINGKAYYYYRDFDFDDFNWISVDEEESYKTRNINSIYETLISHFIAIGKQDKNGARELYHNSILSVHEYFKYSNSKTELQEVYDDSK